MYFTSDTHFDHRNVIRYCNRPFANTDEMNQFIISEWNKVVKKEDIIYHLGDFAGWNLKAAEEILKQLNGRKFLCIGSHDKQMLKLPQYFEEIKESFLIKINGQQIFLSHYLHKIWPKSHYGSWHLFGHSHGRMNWYAEQEGKLLDVGVDNHNFRPWSLNEIAKVMETRPLNFSDLRRRKLA
jgi:calcineurin-like phosphoesterase family protein